MEVAAMRSGLRQAIASFRTPTKRPRCPLAAPPQHQHQPRRFLATPTTTSQPDAIHAAAPIQFDAAASDASSLDMDSADTDYSALMPRLRIVPASPSYFTGKPDFTDDLLSLQSLFRTHQTLPVVAPGLAPRIAWKTLAQYKVTSHEPVKSARYKKIIDLLHRLNHIHPSLMPSEVSTALKKYMRDVQPFLNVPTPGIVDEYGRARGLGRRKASHAVAFLVEGDGEVLVNGKSLTQAFGRLHDRESAVWALKATERVDKYNVWAIVKGGGTTGQAEALTLAVARALMVHEPMLKPALRRAGCVTRDPRRVERKKPGKLKARKMPAWVKR